jgi:hypothetical protein
MVASPGENPPSEASPDFAYEPYKGSRVAVGGECQTEEAAGLVPRSFPRVPLVFFFPREVSEELRPRICSVCLFRRPDSECIFIKSYRSALSGRGRPSYRS